MTPELEARLVALYVGGHTVEEVARAEGVSRYAVRRALGRAGTRTRARGPRLGHRNVPRDELRDLQVLDLRAAGLSWGQIGRRLGVSKQRAQQIGARAAAAAR